MTSNLGSDRDESRLSRDEAEQLLRRLSAKAHRRRARRALQPALLTITVVIAIVGATWMLLRVLAPNTSPGPRPREIPPSPEVPPHGGRIAFTREGPDGGIYQVNADGSGLRQLTSGPSDRDPAWSPDGSRIAFARDGIYVMNADGTGETRVTDSPADSSPAWSPDGSRIAFSREPERDLYTVDLQSGEVIRLTNDPLVEYTPAWSPDGTKIAFVGYSMASGGAPPSPLRLFVMSSDGSDRVEIGPPNASEPEWSPDGTKLAFAAYDDPFGSGSLFVIDADGTRLREIFSGSGPANATGSPTWSPDGNRIAFMNGERIEDLHVFLLDLEGGTATQLTSGPQSDLSPSWGP